MSFNFINTATDTLACAGVAYVGKICLDLASSLLAGRAYTRAANLSDFALIGGVFYLAKLVSDAAFNRFFSTANKTELQISKTLIAAKLTALALIPLKITVAMSTAVYALPVCLVGTELANRIRAAIQAKPAATQS